MIEKLLQKYSQNLEFSVSYTTRPPRESEMHGKNYFFVTKEEFHKKIENDDFIEWC